MKQSKETWEDKLTQTERKEYSLLIIATYGIILLISFGFAHLIYYLVKLLK